MDRDLAGTLKDLGLSATESSAYVALLRHCGDGPISAYRLAQILGRDPANTTKVVGMMAKRGAVTAHGKRPRRYAPAPPREFIERLTANLQTRRDDAIARLERIGTAPADESLHPLATRAEADETARRLLDAAERVVLVGADRRWLDDLADTLRRLREERGVAVVAHAPAVRNAPGPWLQLVVDGTASLSAVAAPDGEALVHGHWSRNPGEAFLVHRALAAAPRASAAAADAAAGTSDAAPASGEADEDAPLTFVHRRRRRG